MLLQTWTHLVWIWCENALAFLSLCWMNASFSSSYDLRSHQFTFDCSDCWPDNKPAQKHLPDTGIKCKTMLLNIMDESEAAVAAGTKLAFITHSSVLPHQTIHLHLHLLNLITWVLFSSFNLSMQDGSCVSTIVYTQTRALKAAFLLSLIIRQLFPFVLSVQCQTFCILSHSISFMCAYTHTHTCQFWLHNIDSPVNVLII